MVSASSKAKPLVWGLVGARHGDNQQVEALLNALGWPCELKPLRYNRLFMLPNAALGASLASLKTEHRQRLGPPWPDLVVGVGRRSVPVARWIKARSGGRTRLVQIGRPRAPLGLFDLVITTAQYGLPAGQNVLLNPLPLGSHQAEPLPQAGLEAWRARFAEWPKPWIGVLMGGTRWPFVLDGSAGEALGRGVAALLAKRGGGHAIAAGGPRTEAAALEGFERAAGAAASLFPFAPGAANPYRAMLELCDGFVVTGDSVSMIGEAVASGRPVQIFDVPRRRLARFVSASAGVLAPFAASGLVSPPRDVARFHDALFAEGLARPLGQDAPQSPQEGVLEDETERTVRRIKDLMGAG